MLLTEAVKALAFAGRDAMVAALTTEGIKTPDDLLAYDCCRLNGTPPDPATVTSLLTALTVHDGTIKDDVPSRTTLGQILRILYAKDVAAATGVDPTKEGEKAAANAFGVKRYAGLQAVTMTRISQSNRVEGATLKRTSEDLDQGTLQLQSYQLKTLVSSLMKAEERTSTIGGLQVVVNTDTTENLSKNGEVLIAIYRHGQMMLAAGMREVTASKDTPLAASRGDFGMIKIAKPTAADPKATTTVRWHATPDSVNAYLLDAMKASCYITPNALVACHKKLHELIVDLLNQNFNYESAVQTVLTANSGFKGANAIIVPASTGGAPTKEVSQKDYNKLKSHNETLQRQLNNSKNKNDPSAGDKRFKQADSLTTPTRNERLCHGFNEAGGCRFAPNCTFAHKCSKCGASDHGKHECTA